MVFQRKAKNDAKDLSLQTIEEALNNVYHSQIYIFLNYKWTRSDVNNAFPVKNIE